MQEEGYSNRSIPVLTGKAAEDFLRREKEARKARGTVSFKKQAEAARAVWKKAKL